MSLSYVLRSVFALIIIIWLANVLLKQLNKYMQGQAKSIEIIERFSITKSSSLAIVKILDRYYLMSFNETGNEILKEFTTDEANEIVEVMQNQESSDPSQLLSQIDLSKLKDKYAKFFGNDQE